MKTNVPIVLEDEQLNKLACLVAGKHIKRRISRKEIIEICERHIGGLLEMADPMPQPPQIVSPHTGDAERQLKAAKRSMWQELARVDHNDPLSRTMARPNDPSYVIGWNKVKRDGERRKA